MPTYTNPADRLIQLANSPQGLIDQAFTFLDMVRKSTNIPDIEEKSIGMEHTGSSLFHAGAANASLRSTNVRNTVGLSTSALPSENQEIERKSEASIIVEELN